MAVDLTLFQRIKFKLKNKFQKLLDNTFIFGFFKGVAEITLTFCFLLLWYEPSYLLIAASFGLHAAWLSFKTFALKYALNRSRGRE